MSGKEKTLLDQSRRMGKPIPDRIKNKPILKTGLALYFDAFIELQNDRDEKRGIPWTTIIKYAEFYEFSNVQTEYLLYFIRRLDNCYSNWLNKKRS